MEFHNGRGKVSRSNSLPINCFLCLLSFFGYLPMKVFISWSILFVLSVFDRVSFPWLLRFFLGFVSGFLSHCLFFSSHLIVVSVCLPLPISLFCFCQTSPWFFRIHILRATFISPYFFPLSNYFRPFDSLLHSILFAFSFSQCPSLCWTSFPSLTLPCSSIPLFSLNDFLKYFSSFSPLLSNYI